MRAHGGSLGAPRRSVQFKDVLGGIAFRNTSALEIEASTLRCEPCRHSPAKAPTEFEALWVVALATTEGILIRPGLQPLKFLLEGAQLFAK